MTKWVALYLSCRARSTTVAFSRKPIVTGRIVFHVVNLRGPDDVDDTVKGWITESLGNRGLTAAVIAGRMLKRRRR
jgi:hypothetical protein